MTSSDFSWKPLSPSSSEWTAGSLALPLPTLSTETSCGEAFEWFMEHSDLRAAAILDPHGSVKGIVNRLRFLSGYARRYYPELYSKHSVLKLGNPNPLIVDRHMSAADLGATVVFEQPDALIECFVVTDKDHYFGVASGEALMRCKVELLVAHQTELKQTLSRLDEASKAKSNFLAMMSHELRTPLNAIIGFSEIIAGEHYGSKEWRRYREYARDIHGAGRHLLSLINDILDLSKAEAGRLELHCEPVDVGLVAGDSLTLIAEKVANQGVATRTDIPADLPLLFADPLRLKQILLNLLSNAAKFTEKGYVEIALSLNAAGEFVVRIADTGVGMDPKTIPIALQPFQQVDSSISRKFEGTGLGLTLVKTLVEQHSGRLEIESALNVGTTVLAIFPAYRVYPQEVEDQLVG